MKLHELKPAAGSKKAPKRVGRQAEPDESKLNPDDRLGLTFYKDTLFRPHYVLFLCSPYYQENELPPLRFDSKIPISGSFKSGAQGNECNSYVDD